MIKLQGQHVRIINYDEALVILRHNQQVTYVDGKPIEPVPDRYDLKANVQPVMGLQLLIVPEADRFKEQYYVWSEFKIQLNDQIVRNGINFQVQQIEPWGDYTKARMVRIDVGPNTTNPQGVQT